MGKPEYPVREKALRAREKTKNKPNQCMASMLRYEEHWPHLWEVIVHTSVPTLLP